MKRKSIFIKGCILFLLLQYAAFSPVISQESSVNPCLPAMNSGDRDRLNKPENGMLIFNITTGCIDQYLKGKWKSFCETPNTATAGKVIYDSLQHKFMFFTGEQWISLETFIDQYRLINKEDTNVLPPQVTTVVPVEETASSPPEQPSPDDCSQPPTKALAGIDLVDIEEVKLGGNPPEHGTGQWFVLKGDSGIVEDPSDPNSRFTGKQGITYELRWQISTACDTSFDDVLARIRFPCSPEPSQANAGPDRFNLEVCYLKANVPKSGKGSWSIVRGEGGRIHDPEIHNTLFTGEAGASYILRWTIRTKCGLTQDDVNISFKPPCKPDPTIVDAGEDQLDVISCKLNANRPVHGNGKWYIVSGNGGRIISPTQHDTEFEGLPEETYWLKWAISNECGKSEDGVVVRFKKRCPSTFVDERDGQSYTAVEIGDQCWMAENLNYQGTVYYCYEDMGDNCNTYGALYDWTSAMNGSKEEKSQGSCPKGWHVPSDEEWETLVSAPGINAQALRPEGPTGFRLNYGGTRYPNGRYFNKREYAFYWSSSSSADYKAWNRYFNAESNEADHYSTHTENGFSVRCVLD